VRSEREGGWGYVSARGHRRPARSETADSLEPSARSVHESLASLATRARARPSTRTTRESHLARTQLCARARRSARGAATHLQMQCALRMLWRTAQHAPPRTSFLQAVIGMYCERWQPSAFSSAGCSETTARSGSAGTTSACRAYAHARTMHAAESPTAAARAPRREPRGDRAESERAWHVGSILNPLNPSVFNPSLSLPSCQSAHHYRACFHPHAQPDSPSKARGNCPGYIGTAPRTTTGP
jgi:hypothetical protein